MIFLTRIASVICVLFLAMESTVNSYEESLSREKRFIVVNPTKKITVGFLWVASIYMMLPTLAPVDNFFHYGRTFKNIPSFEDQESPDDFLIDPGYKRQAERLMSYFALLNIETLSCQERFICELAENPRSFSPVTNLMFREMRRNHGPFTKSKDSLMWRYMRSAERGLSISGAVECERAYPLCPFPAHKLLNMPVIKVWQYIADKIDLDLV